MGSFSLAETLRVPGQNLAQVIDAAWEFASAADPEQRNGLLVQLQSLMGSAPLDVLGQVALLCGALVEKGASPELFPLVLFERIATLLDTIPTTDEGEFELPEAYYDCERAAAAVLSRSVHLRSTLQSKPQLLAKIHRYSERYGFLGKILRVLDDEPLIVLHPSSARAWRMRIGGIADNFQLHTLLLDALAGDGPAKIAGTRPEMSAVAAATDGATADAPSVASDWQLANWPGVQPDGTLSSATTHWIWNEGFPAEIAAIDGTRLVAIGSSSIHRSWNSRRVFSGMSGFLRVEESLNPETVADLLARMIAERSF